MNPFDRQVMSEVFRTAYGARARQYIDSAKASRKDIENGLVTEDNGAWDLMRRIEPLDVEVVTDIFRFFIDSTKYKVDFTVIREELRDIGITL